MSRRATAAITESGTEFANSEILRQKELFRDAALANVLLLRQIRRALEPKATNRCPMSSLSICSTSSSARGVRAADRNRRHMGRYAELFDYDAGHRRFVLPDAQDEEIRRQRGSRVKLKHSLARTLVTARTWPF